MPKLLRRKKKKSGPAVKYTMPYEGSEGTSMSVETAKKMWANKASADESRLGYTLTQDANGNFTARTKLSSKA